jgi:malate synthase
VGRWAGGDPVLADPAQWAGRAGANMLLRNKGLHIELVIDPAHPIGATDRAHLADIVVEAALTTICDWKIDRRRRCEDKVAAYANWLGLLRGDLQASFVKGGATQTRRLAPDRIYVAPMAGRSPCRGARCCWCAMSAT